MCIGVNNCPNYPMTFYISNLESSKKVPCGGVPPPSTGALEVNNSDKTEEKMLPQHLSHADQSDDNVGIAVPSIPPMITAEGPALLEFAAAASTQQE
eukprot:3592592-Ditylum_brightwellii.AAC.1